jgi:hypothetical protein
MRLLSRLLHREPRCTSRWEHPPHDSCPGISYRLCDLLHWHGPHWLDDGVLCRGAGLGGICPHGEQMLNACDYCA